MKVLIIGGGVVGLCTAFYLEREGYEVTIADRGDITNGCSFGNMGYISPSHFIPLASPGIVAQGLKWMLSASSPFYIRPRLGMDLIRWGLTFWRQANAKTVERNAPHLDKLLQLSRNLATDFAHALPAGFSLTEKGCLMLYKNPKTAHHEEQLAQQAAGFGLKTTLLDKAGVQQLEPQVEVNALGGVLYTDDCHLNPAQLMQALVQYLKEKGVQFKLNTEITGFEKNGQRVTAAISANEKITADEVVIANGSWLPQTAAKLGISLLLQPGKGYSFVQEGVTQNLQYPSILVDARVATTPIKQWLRVGGTMELGRHDNRIRMKRVAAIYQAFKEYYPTVNMPMPEEKQVWYGYRPVTPDGLPYIGRAGGYGNISIAGGACHAGRFCCHGYRFVTV